MFLGIFMIGWIQECVDRRFALLGTRADGGATSGDKFTVSNMHKQKLQFLLFST